MAESEIRRRKALDGIRPGPHDRLRRAGPRSRGEGPEGTPGREVARRPGPRLGARVIRPDRKQGGRRRVGDAALLVFRKVAIPHLLPNR